MDGVASSALLQSDRSPNERNEKRSFGYGAVDEM